MYTDATPAHDLLTLAYHHIPTQHTNDAPTVRHFSTDYFRKNLIIFLSDVQKVLKLIHKQIFLEHLLREYLASMFKHI